MKIFLLLVTLVVHVIVKLHKDKVEMSMSMEMMTTRVRNNSISSFFFV